jgi:putative oxidoreductase
MRQTLILLDNQYRDFGLLILRVGLGAMFIAVHGWPKMVGGPERWEALGTSAGLPLLPVAWGFLAAFAETVGALFLLLGFFTRYALVLLIVTMVMATSFHLGRGDGLKGSAHAIEMGIVFIALFLTGPGKYSIDSRFRQPRA